jgi:hypothetical protein
MLRCTAGGITWPRVSAPGKIRSMAKVTQPKKTTDVATHDVVFTGSRFVEIEMRLQRIERRLKIKGRTIVKAKDGSYIMK